MPTTYSPWFLLLFAVPLLLLGQSVIRRVPVLARLNIPVPVVGGLLFSVAATVLGASFGGKVDAMWWTWVVTPEPEWLTGPARNLNLPLLVAFFTCVGLGAPLKMLMGGGRMLVVLLLGTTLLAVLQNVVGVAVARAMGAPDLLGVACGSLTLVGGHGTALGFAPSFEQAGLTSAAAIGASAATFALVAGALLSGPIGAWLLRKHAAHRDPAQPAAQGPVVADFLADCNQLRALGRTALLHAIVIVACVKVGAWASFGLDRAGLALPAYMGALLVGFALRAVHDALGWNWLRGEVIGRFALVLLPLFLVVTLAALNLRDLAAVAGPMLVILAVNIAMTIVFVATFAWPLLGRDHEAGVASAGFAGFAIGSTATAVAAMDAITREKGPAPRATTIVPPTGGFLIDLTNAPVISAFLRQLA
jgi:ESS family glutamate:Na+ symporter